MMDGRREGCRDGGSGGREGGRWREGESEGGIVLLLFSWALFMRAGLAGSFDMPYYMKVHTSTSCRIIIIICQFRRQPHFSYNTHIHTTTSVSKSMIRHMIFWSKKTYAVSYFLKLRSSYEFAYYTKIVSALLICQIIRRPQFQKV